MSSKRPPPKTDDDYDDKEEVGGSDGVGVGGVGVGGVGFAANKKKFKQPQQSIDEPAASFAHDDDEEEEEQESKEEEDTAATPSSFAASVANNNKKKFKTFTKAELEILFLYFTTQIKTVDKARRCFQKLPPKYKAISRATFYNYADQVLKGIGYKTSKEVRKEINKIDRIKEAIDKYYNDQEKTTRKPKTDVERAADYRKNHQHKINNKQKEKRQKKLEELYTNGTRNKKMVSPSMISITFLKATQLMKEYSDKIDDHIQTLEPTKINETYPYIKLRPEDIRSTTFDNYLFCQPEALTALENEWLQESSYEFTKLGIIGNGEYGKEKTKFHKFDSTLDHVRNLTLRKNITIAHKFRYVAAHVHLSKWEEDDISQLIKDPNLFQFDMAMCEIHDSAKPIEQLEFFPEHKDKVGNLVTFWGTSGYSYNFIVYPRDKPVKDKTEYGIEKADGTSWKEYDEFRQQLQQHHHDSTTTTTTTNDNNKMEGPGGSNSRRSNHNKKDDFEKLETFESTLLNGNGKNDHCYYGIRVYKVSKGDRLIFPAKYYTHCTVVPKQETKRTLAIFYRMEEHSTSLKKVK